MSNKFIKVCRHIQLLKTSFGFSSRMITIKRVDLSYTKLSVAKFSTSVKLKTMAEADNTKELNVDFEGLLKTQKDDKVLIIDVREQKEIDETGKLPCSIHIPMGKVAIELETKADDDFQKQYQKPKPSKDTKIILSCRSGMRSRKVQEELQKLGYKNAYNYIGGWTEWESNQKS